jgi:hypothetical protein
MQKMLCIVLYTVFFITIITKSPPPPPPPPTHNYACIEINMTLTRFVVTADLQKADKVRF